MNVIFLNTNYFPGEEKLKVLAKMQADIHFTKVHYMFQLRNYHPSMVEARKAELHKMWRARWTVITTEPVDT